MILSGSKIFLELSRLNDKIHMAREIRTVAGIWAVMASKSEVSFPRFFLPAKINFAGGGKLCPASFSEHFRKISKVRYNITTRS